LTHSTTTLTTKETLYTPAFFRLCFSSLLFFTGFNILIPELPAFLSSLGGADYKGWIIALFATAAGLSRPFSGKLADTIGRKPIIAFGIIVSFLCGLLYPFLTTVFFFLILRFLHGFSTGFSPTGVTAYLSDIVPENKRGEAMGWLGLSNSIGMTLGPVLGGFLVSSNNIYHLFYLSSSLSLFSLLILFGLKETLPDRKSFRLSQLFIKRDEIIEPQVLPAALVMLISCIPYGLLVTLLPDMSIHFGIENKGIPFAYLTASSILTRLVAGSLSDRLGRVLVLKISAIFVSISLLLFAYANSPEGLLFACFLMGFSFGMNSPTLMAWTVDLSRSDNKGKGLATTYIALELGITLGAYFSGWWYANKIENLPSIFFTTTCITMLSWFYLIWYEYQNKRRSISEFKI